MIIDFILILLLILNIYIDFKNLKTYKDRISALEHSHLFLKQDFELVASNLESVQDLLNELIVTTQNIQTQLNNQK